MKSVRPNTQSINFLIVNDDACRVLAGIQCRSHAQAFRGARGTDELDDGFEVNEWAPTPILGDMAEEPVLDLVPLRCSWREVADANLEAGAVGQFLQFNLPEA